MAVSPALLAVALMAALGAKALTWSCPSPLHHAPQLTHVVRSQVLVLRESAFAEAARRRERRKGASRFGTCCRTLCRGPDPRHCHVRGRGSDGGRAELPSGRRATRCSVVGQHSERRARIDDPGTLGHALSRSGDRHLRARAELVR